MILSMAASKIIALKMIKSQSGQSTTEAIVCSLVLLFFVFGLLTTIYLATLFVQLNWLSYETLICRESLPRAVCLDEFKKKSNSMVIFGKIEKLVLTEGNSRRSFEFNFQMKALSKWKIQKKFYDQIAIPLQL